MKKLFDFIENCNDYMMTLQNPDKTAAILKNCGKKIAALFVSALSLFNVQNKLSYIIATELLVFVAILTLLSLFYTIWFYITRFLNHLVDSKKI